MAGESARNALDFPSWAPTIAVERYVVALTAAKWEIPDNRAGKEVETLGNESKPEVRWERMTGPDVAAMAKVTNVALIPIGCTEMHGPHLPTGTDAFNALAVCERAARREPAIVLPAIFYNINDEMQEYPGVIHISQETLARLYHDICLECARNGFDHVVFVVSHGGAQTPIERVLGDLLQTRNRTGRWPYFAIQTFTGDLMRPEREECFGVGMDGHGGPVETSHVMASASGLVRLDRVTKAGPVGRRSLPYCRTRVPWNRLVPAGYTGDPRPADGEKGERMLDAAAGRLAELITKFRTFEPEKDS